MKFHTEMGDCFRGNACTCISNLFVPFHSLSIKRFPYCHFFTFIDICLPFYHINPGSGSYRYVVICDHNSRSFVGTTFFSDGEVDIKKDTHF